MLSCLSARLSIRPSVPLPSAPPNRHGERGERRGGLIPMLGVVIRSACPFNCVWSDGTTAISFCVLSVWIVWIACPPSYDCRAILRRLGRVSVEFDYFPACFVSPAALYSFPQLPRPVARLIPSVPSCLPRLPLSVPFCLIRAHPIPSHSFRPFDCFAPIVLIAITPRLSCRINGADFLNASNSMPLKSGLRSGSFLAACLPSCGFHAVPSARLIISSKTLRPLLAYRYRHPITV